MGRSKWRCRNPECEIRFGAVLGNVTDLGGLELAREVLTFSIYFDTRRVAVRCPACGVTRDFRGAAVFSSHRGTG